jgi:hypothetical protein
MSEDRFIVGIGEGKFNVIAGHNLNAEPLTRAEADRLAHEPVKPAAKLPPREAPPPPPARAGDRLASGTLAQCRWLCRF